MLFKNPRDKLQNLALAKQMYPDQIDFFLNQYEKNVKRPFRYLLIDLKTTTQDNCQLLTNGCEPFTEQRGTFQAYLGEVLDKPCDKRVWVAVRHETFGCLVTRHVTTNAGS